MLDGALDDSPTDTDAGGAARPDQTSHWLCARCKHPLPNWLVDPATPDDLDNYITGRDLSFMRAVGFDHVRLEIGSEIVLDESAPDLLNRDGLAHVHRAINAILENGLNVIVDLHSLELGHTSQYSWALENVPGFVDVFTRFWGSFATDLKSHDPERVMFGLLNEPAFYGHEQDWPPMQESIAKAAREGAPSHTLLVTSARWSNREKLMEIKPLSDPNVVYDFHYYEPGTFTGQALWTADKEGWAVNQAQVGGLPYPATTEAVQPMIDTAASAGSKSLLQQYLAQGWNADKHDENLGAVQSFAEKNGVHVMCTEFGVYRRYMDQTSKERWLTDVRTALEKHRIGYTFFDYDYDFGFARRGAGRIMVDEITTRALGLNVAAVSDPMYTAAYSDVDLPSCSDGLVDDLEDGDSAIVPVGGREGTWTVTADPVGTTIAPTPFAPFPSGAEGSGYAARISGHTTTGPFVEAILRLGLSGGKPYDARRFKGVSFWAKGRGDIQIEIPNGDTVSQGGLCTVCDSHFGAPLLLTSTWKHYTVLFSGLKQNAYYGDQVVVFDPSKLYELTWKTAMPGSDYEISIDNVAFVGCTP